MGVFTLYELVMYCVKCVIVFAYEIQIGLTHGLYKLCEEKQCDW